MEKENDSLRINHGKTGPGSPGSGPVIDRLQRAIDNLNGKPAERSPDVIKLAIEIPVENARKFLKSFADFIESITPKGPSDGSN